MSKPSISKQQTPLPRYVMAAVVGAAFVAAIVYWQSNGKDEPQGGATEHKTTEVFGPGVLSDSGDHSSLSQREEATTQQQLFDAPGRLVVDANQQLVIDSGFLEVINYFLLEQSGADRASALQRYLKSKLPPSAYAQAIVLVEHYVAYMKAHDNLLLGQNLGSEDIGSRSRNIERLQTWLEQRHRLRMDMLGETAVRTWYQNDDAELNQVLQELQQRNQANSQAQDTESDAEHERDMQNILNKATKSYATLAQEGQIWSQRLAKFQAAVAQINQQGSTPTLQRNRQIAELLQASFSNEEERQRVRDMMP